MEQNAYQIVANYGAVAVIFVFAIKEFFSYLKNKKNGNGNDRTEKDAEQDIDIAVIKEKLIKIETNDLVHLKLSMDKLEKDNKEDHGKIFDKLEELLKK